MTVIAVHDSSARAQPDRRPGGHRLFLLVFIAVLTVAALRFLRMSDLSRAFEVVRHVGWPMAIVLLPTGLTMSLDAKGWQLILATVGNRVRWRALLPVRLAAESLVLSIPGGALAAEAAKLSLLRASTGVPFVPGTASLGLAKASHIRGEAVYLAVAAVIVIGGHAGPGSHGRLLSVVATTGALTVALTSSALFMLLRDVNRTFSLVERRAPKVAWVERWLVRARGKLGQLDRATQGFFAASAARRLACLAPFALEWFVEGLETWLILHCIGAAVSPGSAIVVDGVGSLLRAIAVFVPAGLGVQDTAQIAMLGILGVPDAAVTGTALILVKRTKEVFWLFTGLAIGAGNRKAWLKLQTESP
jgi:hypothetical protein